MGSTGVQKSRYRRPACPFCRRELQVVRIFYGDPSPALLEQSRAGELALGGGCASPDAHDWYCRGCMRTFNAAESATTLPAVPDPFARDLPSH
jgi:hypothetical protein